MAMIVNRGTPSYYLVTFLRQSSSYNATAHFRNLTTDTTQNLDAKDCNFTHIVKEICRITRTKPRWENTLISQYPSINFSDPSFFLLYLNHQNNAFLSLRFFLWLCSHCAFSPDQSSYNALFDALVDAGACKAAKSLLDYPGFTPKPTSLECYIRCLCKGRMIEDAIGVLADLKKVGFCPMVETWDASLLCCLKVRRTDLIWKLYEQMIENGVVANINVETVGYLIKAFCQENQVFKGYELLRQVLENGFCPDSTVFNTLIKGFCKIRQYARVSELLHIMIAKKCNPGLYTYQTIISGLFQSKNPEGFRVFNDLKDRGYFPDRFMYTTVIENLCDMGLLGEARKMWFEMSHKGLVPNEGTYNAMIYGYCKIGDFVEARKTFEDMLSRGYAVNSVSYNTIISAYCKIGHLSEAREFLEDMLSRGYAVNAVSYNTIISGYCKIGHLSEARQFFEDMISRGCAVNAVTYNTIISALCLHGRTDEALRLFQEMSQKGVAGNLITYSLLIENLCLKGDLLMATKLLNKLVAHGVKHDRNLEPVALIYDGIITWSCKERNYAQGMEWLVNMLSQKLKPQKRTFEHLINGLSKEDRLDDILIVLDLMFRVGYGLEKSIIHSLVSKFIKENFNFPNFCLEKFL